jgi:hypothetical protein
VKWAIAMVALGASVGFFGACKQQAPDPNGVGPYVFGHTTRGQIHDGNCQPDVLEDGRKAIWCMALPPYKVGTKAADVDAYFAGTDNTAPLIELQLKVRGCIEQEAEAWMRERFGTPIENKATRVYWQNSFLWAAAELPSAPGRCVIHFLPLSETTEIARIKAK